MKFNSCESGSRPIFLIIRKKYVTLCDTNFKIRLEFMHWLILTLILVSGSLPTAIMDPCNLDAELVSEMLSAMGKELKVARASNKEMQSQVQVMSLICYV